MFYFLRAAFRSAIVFPAILLFLLHGFIITLFVRRQRRRTELLTRNVSAYSRFALFVMGVKLRVHSSEQDRRNRDNALIVCNHLSYLDMMVLAAVSPSVFVTSVDMGQVFFLGTMAEIGGSLFIERRNRMRVDYDIDQIVAALDAGFDVTLFPEGTSTNGESVLPFKKGLLVSAARAGKAVIPVTLKYSEVDRSPLSAANRDYVCWYGAMPFLSHFIKLMSLKSVKVDLHFHQSLQFAPEAARDQIALEAYIPIAASYGRPLTC